MKVFSVPANLDVVVTSYGGTGSTFFIKFLSKYKSVNHPHDTGSLKHTAYPPVSIKPSQKFIYLFGDPVHATISLFRREFHHLQSQKIQQAANMNSPIPPSMTLEEYAEEGVDRFRFREHFFNWYHSSVANPILFVRYETLFNNLSTISEFLELPSSFIDEFPKKKKRKSVHNDVSNETLQQLEKIYGEFKNELEKIPDIKCLEAKEMDPLKKLLNGLRFYTIRAMYKSRKSMRRVYEEKLKNESTN